MRWHLARIAAVLILLTAPASIATARPQTTEAAIRADAPRGTAIAREDAGMPEGLRVALRLAPLVGLVGMFALGISLSMRAARRFAA